jgi:hypothetical protein
VLVGLNEREDDALSIQSGPDGSGFVLSTVNDTFGDRVGLSLVGEDERVAVRIKHRVGGRECRVHGESRGGRSRSKAWASRRASRRLNPAVRSDMTEVALVALTVSSAKEDEKDVLKAPTGSYHERRSRTAWTLWMTSRWSVGNDDEGLAGAGEKEGGEGWERVRERGLGNKR